METCTIIGSTSLRLHFLPYARFFHLSKGGGAWSKWPNGKYAYGCNVIGRRVRNIGFSYTAAVSLTLAYEDWRYSWIILVQYQSTFITLLAVKPGSHVSVIFEFRVLIAILFVLYFMWLIWIPFLFHFNSQFTIAFLVHFVIIILLKLQWQY